MDDINSPIDWYPPTPPTPSPRRRPVWKKLLKFFGLFLSFFVVLVLVVMGPTIYTTLSYYFTAPAEEYSAKYELPVSVSDDLRDIQEVADLLDQRSLVPAQDTIIIPKLNVDAPIVYPTESSNTAILEAIKDGVAHYPNTAMPGRVGNSFLTAHSSYYWWSGGKYNQIFALLDRLQPGDLVYIYYQGGRYVYRINRSFIVNPDQVEVLNQTANPILTLMTCTPLGTNLRRLIVQADLVGRPPVDADAFMPFQQIPKLPTILPV